MTFWNSATILFTAVAALTSFFAVRDKSNNFNLFGFAALAAVIGVAFSQIQEKLGEAADTAEKARIASDDTRKILQANTATLAATRDAVAQVNRSLTAFDAVLPMVLTVEVPCEEREFKLFCADAASRHHQFMPLSTFTHWPRSYGTHWTGWAAVASSPYIKISMLPMGSEMVWYFESDDKPTVSTQHASAELIVRGTLRAALNKGTIFSPVDLKGKHFILASPSYLFDFKPISIAISVGHGQQLGLTGARLTQDSYGDRVGPILARKYVYSFPKNEDPRITNDFDPVLLEEEFRPENIARAQLPPCRLGEMRIHCPH